MDGSKTGIEKYVVSNIPAIANYVPNFITEKEEAEILRRVYNVPHPKWTQLRHRRLQNWGGIPHPKGMIPEEIPDWLKYCINKVSSINVFEDNIVPNHVLVNEYLSHQGIMPHSDGPLFHPVITTISCGSHTSLDFYKRLSTTEQHHSHLEFSLLLERRSLLVLREDLYHNYLHCIAERDEDIIFNSVVKNLDMCSTRYNEGDTLKRGTRLSLTIRHVPKTSKLKIKIG